MQLAADARRKSYLEKILRIPATLRSIRVAEAFKQDVDGTRKAVEKIRERVFDAVGQSDGSLTRHFPRELEFPNFSQLNGSSVRVVEKEDENTVARSPSERAEIFPR